MAAALTALFRQVHEQLRQELDGLDDDALNWIPTTDANSIATIIIHIVGSEAETLRCVAGVECVRDRDAEFVRRRLPLIEVLGLLEEADDLINELEPYISPSQLEALLPLPTLPKEAVRPGLTWLAGNYGHAREHVGQIQLTRQLHHLKGATRATEG